ncbi:MAG: hypothetical protein OXH34_07785 [Bacteroidetes bacterium]|nr:hypothetical protein [Bacteroidota bacterium]
MPPGQDCVVAYQGEPGAYSEIASRSFFPLAGSLVPCETFDLVFQRVQREEATFGVIPIENSLAGSIHQNYDLLLRHRLTIIGELKLRILHHLIANPGVGLSQVRRIFSHPQALMQCRRNIARLGKLEIIPTYDTAGSVKQIKEEKILDGAAIASDLADPVIFWTPLCIIQHKMGRLGSTQLINFGGVCPDASLAYSEKWRDHR